MPAHRAPLTPHAPAPETLKLYPHDPPRSTHSPPDLDRGSTPTTAPPDVGARPDAGPPHHPDPPPRPSSLAHRPPVASASPTSSPNTAASTSPPRRRRVPVLLLDPRRQPLQLRCELPRRSRLPSPPSLLPATPDARARAPPSCTRAPRVRSAALTAASATLPRAPRRVAPAHARSLLCLLLLLAPTPPSRAHRSAPQLLHRPAPALPRPRWPARSQPPPLTLAAATLDRAALLRHRSRLPPPSTPTAPCPFPATAGSPLPATTPRFLHQPPSPRAHRRAYCPAHLT
nr:classical arabinogalactan protein 9-like [Aegilops tauschii subsp. strangulata]